MTEKYFVIERYYDNGKTTAEIINYRDGCESGYIDGFYEEHKTCDVYATLWDTYEAAQAYAKLVRLA